MNRISELKILQGVPFEKDTNTVLTFTSLNQQKSFFEDYAIESFEDLSFVKGFLFKKVRLECDIEDVYNANYLMWKNNDGKWFYAYITGFEFVSENAVEVTFDIDYFQSYIGDIVFMQSNIEREHTKDDSFGSMSMYITEDDILPIRHTTGGMDNKTITSWKVCVMYKPNLFLEGLLNGNTTYTSPQGTTRGVIEQAQSNIKYTDLQGGTTIGVNDTLYAGANIAFFNIANSTDMTTLKNELSRLTATGYNIINVFMIPKNWDITTDNFRRKSDFVLDNAKNPYLTNGELNGYVPVNTKCYAYPFTYLKVTNRQGTIKNYKYERFYTKTSGGVQTYNFKTIESIYGDYKIDIIPQGYESEYDITRQSPPITQYQKNFDKGVGTEKGTSCIWNADLFLKNLIGNAGKVVAGAGMIASGVGAGVGAGLIASSAGNLGMGILGGTGAGEGHSFQTGEKAFKEGIGGGASKISEAIFNSAFESDNAGIKITDTVNLIMEGFFGISFICMLPEVEDISIIDRYFSVYGYKFNNLLQRPNILGRRRFNYVRTSNARITGEIPIEARNYIIDKLNRGVTFWHDLNNFDYGDFRSTGYVNDIISNDLTSEGKIF